MLTVHITIGILRSICRKLESGIGVEEAITSTSDELEKSYNDWANGLTGPAINEQLLKGHFVNEPKQSKPAPWWSLESVVVAVVLFLILSFCWIFWVFG